MDPDPSTPNSGWTKLMGPTISGGKRPIGLTVVRDPAAPDVPVTLAVLQNGQMLRKIGHDPGTSGCRPTASRARSCRQLWPQAVEFVWKPGMTKIYVYDRATGLWRSDDYGFTWTRIYASPDKGTNKQGFVAGDPHDENIVYVSTSAGLSVVDQRRDGRDRTPRSLTPISVPGGPPGPLAVGADGRIYVATQPDRRDTSARSGAAGSSPRAASPSAWHDLTDELWRNAINDTRELAVGGNGALYVGLSGGVFVLDEPGHPGRSRLGASPKTSVVVFDNLCAQARRSYPWVRVWGNQL